MLCILRIWGFKILFFWFLLWEFCFQFFFFSGARWGRVPGFGFCPLLFHGVKCFGSGASFLLLSLSLSLRFTSMFFVFALPTAVGNSSLFVFFPFRLVSCYAFRLFVCGLPGFFSGCEDLCERET